MSDENKDGGTGVKKLSPVDAYLRVLGAYLALTAAIERGGYDVSPCRFCGEAMVCIPDGLPMCRVCAERAAKEG